MTTSVSVLLRSNMGSRGLDEPFNWHPWRECCDGSGCARNCVAIFAGNRAIHPIFQLNRSKAEVEELLTKVEGSHCPWDRLLVPTAPAKAVVLDLINAYQLKLLDEAGCIAKRVGVDRPTAVHISEARGQPQTGADSCRFAGGSSTSRAERAKPLQHNADHRLPPT